jgi:hypothetical protein
LPKPSEADHSVSRNANIFAKNLFFVLQFGRKLINFSEKKVPFRLYAVLSEFAEHTILSDLFKYEGETECRREDLLRF